MTLPQTLLRRLLPALAGAIALVALVPAASLAATYVVRPTSTVQLGSGWSVTPSTSTADAVLNKNVTQPAAPATSSYVTAGVMSAGHGTSVSVARPPALRTGETLKTITAWAYMSTPTAQSMTLTLNTWTFFGWMQLATANIPALSPAGWYPATTQGTVESWTPNAMAISLTPSGGGSGANVYAAYAQVDTNDPPATPSGSPTPPSAAPAPASPPPANDPPPAPSVVTLLSQTIKLALSSKSVPLTLSCAAGTPGGCQGTVTLRTLNVPKAPAKPGAPRAVTSRCARGCRPLGKAHFQIVAGRNKRVKVHLAHSARRVFGKHQRVTLQATTVVKDNSGHTEVSNTAVTLVRPGASGANSSGPAKPSH